MGNMTVTDVGALFGSLNVTSQAAIVGKISNTVSPGGKEPSFMDVLNAGNNSTDRTIGKSQTDDATPEKKNPAEVKKDTSDRIAGEDRKDAGKTSSTDQQNKADNVNDKTRGEGLNERFGKADTSIDQATETLEQIAGSFLVKVSEILNITPEEAQNILDEMDISATDLLNPETLSAFALRAMGEEDSLSLLTNETSFEQFQNVNDALKELLASESGVGDLSVEELNLALTQIKETDIADDGSEAVVNVEEMTDLQDEKPVIESVVTVKADNDSVAEDKPLDRTATKADPELAQMTTSEGGTLGAEAMLRSQRRFADEGGNQRHGENPGHAEQQGNVFAQNFEQNIQGISQEIQATPQTNMTAAQDIANQILDYMRAQVKPDMQTLEMQLHPASLGNIQISLVNRDGALTANFACQDDQVRAVLENQMIQLQERFEEQGIKVTSIEVSVGTHSFEENLEQQGQNEEQQAQNAPRRVRRLQLGPDFGAEDIEELEGDDRIAAEMMAANGGTMDVQA